MVSRMRTTSKSLVARLVRTSEPPRRLPHSLAARDLISRRITERVVMESTTLSPNQPWAGHGRGSTEYRRLLAALFCAGIAAFAHVYSPQGVLPEISTDLGVRAASAALMVSACTIGLAVGVIPWSMIADRIGRVKAMSVSVITSSVLGL